MVNHFSRRNYLKGGATAVGALAALGVLSKVAPVFAARGAPEGTPRNSSIVSKTTAPSEKNILVVYFSCSGTTERIAQWIVQ